MSEDRRDSSKSATHTPFEEGVHRGVTPPAVNEHAALLDALFEGKGMDPEALPQKARLQEQGLDAPADNGVLDGHSPLETEENSEEGRAQGTELPIEPDPFTLLCAQIKDELVDEDVLPVMSFLGVIEHLRDVLDEETELLERNEITDHASFTTRKTRALRDLEQNLQKARGNFSKESLPRVEALLELLKQKLERNKELLTIHLEAMRELEQLFQKANQDAEKDGTYSPYTIIKGK